MQLKKIDIYSLHSTWVVTRNIYSICEKLVIPWLLLYLMSLTLPKYFTIIINDILWNTINYFVFRFNKLTVAEISHLHFPPAIRFRYYMFRKCSQHAALRQINNFIYSREGVTLVLRKCATYYTYAQHFRWIHKLGIWKTSSIILLQLETRLDPPRGR